MNAFDKIIGYRKEKEELAKLCDMLRAPERYRALGAKLSRGLLISGEPGLGKTLMARCFIEETGWKSYTIRRSKPDGDFVRELGRVFQEAAEHAPAIILLDDIPDSLLRAGRFDRKIDVAAPKEKDAEDIIRFYLQGENLGPSVNFTDADRVMERCTVCCLNMEAVG